MIADFQIHCWDCIPVKYMYLHHILSGELIKKVYEAKECKLSKGDWVQNLHELDKTIGEEFFSEMS